MIILLNAGLVVLAVLVFMLIISHSALYKRQNDILKSFQDWSNDVDNIMAQHKKREDILIQSISTLGMVAYNNGSKKFKVDMQYYWPQVNFEEGYYKKKKDEEK